ncbi:nucleoside phosphorylase [Solitalea sp. MAHUQ-68]|uniref:Uridine phosphorylase n=1 Tax=Solitalea agri TaxID=2953739 RepID=A0A9X2JGJ5_9SPHI|nr:nucleoside phosphorylase [Solitalea agri]MCO4294491.1 nucleoside phosphorylase [Solitalea agri]
MKISETDLILNPDGSVYHLNLLPHEIAETIITVGDQDRVLEVSKHFDRVEVKKQKREFITHTGTIGNKRISVISTGIGTDNIDIVFNELDALVNVDLESRKEKEHKTSLEIIRIGTSGSLQEDVPMDSLLFTTFGIGFDTLMNFYEFENSNNELMILDALKEQLPAFNPYIFSADSSLKRKLAEGMITGMTVTCSGFYAPQGRTIRVKNQHPEFIHQLKSFSYNGSRITNLEMETAGILGMAHVLGHKACSVNAILASRLDQKFSANPAAIVEKAIKLVLERIN